MIGGKRGEGRGEEGGGILACGLARDGEGKGSGNVSPCCVDTVRGYGARRAKVCVLKLKPDLDWKRKCRGQGGSAFMCTHIGTLVAADSVVSKSCQVRECLCKKLHAA